MKIFRAYKTELDPNNKQLTQFTQYAGAARFVFNWALADRIERHKRGEKTNLYEQKKRFNALKHEAYLWLDDVAYCVVGQAFVNLDMAYQNFFRRIKAGKKEVGFPKFKSRKRGFSSFVLRRSIYVKDRQIKLPRLGWIRLKETGYLPQDGMRILSATISEHAGHWFVSLQGEIDIPDPVPGQGEPLGIDVGIKNLAVCSDGRVFDNPRCLQMQQRQLGRLQRELSRRKKGGKNWQKTKVKLARCHFRIGNTRKHALHQVSSAVTAKNKPSVIVIEDLNTKGMVKNHSLAQAVSDTSFAELHRQLEYKAKWQGIKIMTAGRFYPSSKRCSACGEIRQSLSLADRTFICPSCGVILDRDLNAALNLASLAI